MTLTEPAISTDQPVDAFRAIPALTVDDLTPAQFAVNSFRLIAQHFVAPFASMAFRVGAQVVEDVHSHEGTDDSVWQKHTAALLLEAQSHGRACARVYKDQRSTSRIAALAAPLVGASGEPSGAIVLYARCDDVEGAEVLLIELSALCSLISTTLPVLGRMTFPTRVQSPELQSAIVKASDYRSLYQLAFALTNNLRNKVGCDQVALGVPRRQHIRLLSISGMDEVKLRTPGTHHIVQAMEECLDQSCTIVVQNDDNWNDGDLSSGFRLHRQWHDATGNASVLSIPMMLGDRCIGVLSLRRRADRPFVREEVDRIRTLIEPFAPALEVVSRASRSLPAHAVDRTGELARWLVSAHGVGRKILLLLFLCLAGWVALGSWTYSFTVKTMIMSGQVRQMSAPFQGRLASVQVRPGDRVEAGEVLIVFDTSDLELERAQFRAEMAARQIEVDMAIAAGERHQGMLSQAELEILARQLDGVMARIAKSQIVAPSAGMVIRGDLEGRVGEVVPLGELLLEFAPDDQRRLELSIPEHLIEEVRLDLAGEFSSHASPDERRLFTIQHISPAAEVRDGANVVVAHASLERAPDWMRPGMEGAARVKVGKRPIWWLLTHRAVDAIRRRFWL